MPDNKPPETRFSVVITTRRGAAAALTAVALTVPAAAQLAHAGTAQAHRPVLPSLLGIADAVPVAGDVIPASFDLRQDLRALVPTATQRTAAARLGSVSITWNRTLGTPRMIGALGGALSAPRQGSPLTIARSWLAANRGLFGISAADVAHLTVVRNHELPGIGATVITFNQTFDGLTAGIGGVMTVAIDRQGRVASYSGDSVRSSKQVGHFGLSSAQALSKVVKQLAPGTHFVPELTGTLQAGYQVFSAGPFADVQRVKRIAFATPAGGRAAYAVLLVKNIDDAWVEVVDAATGQPLYLKSLVESSGGTIYPNYPGAPKGGKPVKVSFGPTTESPGGYVDPTGLLGLDGITTIGNNADAVAAWTAPIAPADQENRPVSLTGDFNYKFPNSWMSSHGAVLSFTPDSNAAVTNLFFHHNRIHDEYYKFGFTEDAGNFQLNNFGKGGQGGDPVLGSAQSGAIGGAPPVSLGRNNANMLTLPDGIPGLTSMYLWSPVEDAFEGGHRDGDFDATIIQHEYSHGLSNRYVGGGGLGSLGTGQSGAMGEGWGDFLAMNSLFRDGLSRSAVVAAYVGDRTRGIRNYNYAKNPTNYGDYGYDTGGPEVHADGETWTATLWQLRTALLGALHGNQVEASNTVEHLVIDAMPLAPPTPTMLDMRDAIVKSAHLRYGGRYNRLVWSVFGSRGMGKSASADSEIDFDPNPGFDSAIAADNGRFKLHLVNASTGGPVAKARVLVGEFEARATPFITTNAEGFGSARMVGGHYQLTIQAAGFGIQRFGIDVPARRTTLHTISLRPNLLSLASGATLVRSTSENPTSLADGIMDDSESTSWLTKTGDEAYNQGPKATTTIKLPKQARIESISVSVLKPVGVPRFTAARKVKVETSLDGRHWKQAQIATFGFKGPRPAVSDLNLQGYDLRRPVTARFVRVTPVAAFADHVEYGAAVAVAEVEAFGRVDGITPKPPRRDKPVTSSGHVAVGNISQGTLLLPGTEPYRDGVTTTSWKAGCDNLPAANGVDAWVTELPAGSADGLHTITYRGTLPIGEWLLYFYGPDCTPITGGFQSYGAEKVIPGGATHAGFLLLYGGAADFKVTVAEPK